MRQRTTLQKISTTPCRRRLGRFRHISGVDRAFLVFASGDFLKWRLVVPRLRTMCFVVVRDKEPENMVAENNGFMRKWCSDAVAKTPAQPRPRSGRGPIHLSAIYYSIDRCRRLCLPPDMSVAINKNARTYSDKTHTIHSEQKSTNTKNTITQSNKH